MKVSFFKNGYIHIGEDFSYTPPKTEGGITTPAIGHPDCLMGGDYDFNPDTQIIEFDIDNNKVIIKDNPEVLDYLKKEEIQRLLITSEDPTKVDTHGVKGFDIDSCILQRFFGGDRGKEIGFTQRMIYLQMKMRTPEEEIEMKTIFAGYEAKEQYKNFLKTLNS